VFLDKFHLMIYLLTSCFAMGLGMAIGMRGGKFLNCFRFAKENFLELLTLVLISLIPVYFVSGEIVLRETAVYTGIGFTFFFIGGILKTL
jgi:hypothetical protein